MDSVVTVVHGSENGVLERPSSNLERRTSGRDPHVIASLSRKGLGPTLIVVGGLHGNEPAGIQAMRRVLPKLRSLEEKLRGRVYFIAGNTRALAKGTRYLDLDLNRSWTQEDLAHVGTPELCGGSEGLELTELDQLFDSILVTARNEVYVLDLHSTSAPGVPFATVGDTLRNRYFAQYFPVRILLGIEEQLEGTMLEYLNNIGCVTLGFEGGSHDALETIRNHEAMIWLALVNAGIIWEEDVPQLDIFRDHLTAAPGHHGVIEVRYREPVKADDEFKMRPHFKNFDPVAKGDVLARNRYGDIAAPETGMLLMPLYQKLGNDGFFIVRKISRYWLWLSEALRRLKIQELVQYLPGVAADPLNRETLTINTRVARFFPLQVFHLLGFRRRKWIDKKLVVSRRRHDVDSPFVAQSDG
jgi:predicted deacylase